MSSEIFRLYSDDDSEIFVYIYIYCDFPEILMSSVELYSDFLSDKATHRIGPVSESCMLHKNSPRLDPETLATLFFISPHHQAPSQDQRSKPPPRCETRLLLLGPVD